MLPSFVIALMMAAGASAWVYNKVLNRTGGNTQNALIVTSVTSVFVFIITLTVLAIIGNIIDG